MTAFITTPCTFIDKADTPAIAFNDFLFTASLFAPLHYGLPPTRDLENLFLPKEITHGRQHNTRQDWRIFSDTHTQESNDPLRQFRLSFIQVASGTAILIDDKIRKEMLVISQDEWQDSAMPHITHVSSQDTHITSQIITDFITASADLRGETTLLEQQLMETTNRQIHLGMGHRLFNNIAAAFIAVANNPEPPIRYMHIKGITEQKAMNDTTLPPPAVATGR